MVGEVELLLCAQTHYDGSTRTFAVYMDDPVRNKRVQVGPSFSAAPDARRELLALTSAPGFPDLATKLTVEDLNIAGMLQLRSLAKNISDAGLGDLGRLVAYKATQGKWR